MDYSSPLRAAVAIGGFLALAAGPVHAADAIADFYKGKTVTIIVSSASGGTYDAHARLLSRHLSKHLPGNPQVVVQNMPGAGGMVAANHIYNVAAKDGTIIGGVQANVPFEPFYGNTQAQFDAKQFNWLGSPTRETRIWVLSHRVPVDTIEQAQKRELVMGATGVNSTPALYARIFGAVFNLKIKLIAGYTSQTEAMLALERGENDGFPSPTLTSLMVSHPDWIAKKFIKILFQYGTEPHPGLKGVPWAPELAPDAESRSIIEVASASQTTSRPIMMPPGVPADRLAAMRKAVEATYADPEYKAECDKQKLECEGPANGAEVARLIEKTYSTPDNVRKRMVAIYGSGGGK